MRVESLFRLLVGTVMQRINLCVIASCAVITKGSWPYHLSNRVAFMLATGWQRQVCSLPLRVCAQFFSENATFV